MILSASDKTPNPNHPINFIHELSTFTYYLGISPFRIAPTASDNGNNNGFQSVSWKPQSVISLVFNVMGIVRLITEMRISTISPGKFPIYPELYFRLALRFFTIFYKVTVLKRFWVNREGFVKVLNYIKRMRILPVSQFKIQSKCFIRFMCSFCIVQSIAKFLIGTHFVGEIWRLTPSWWLRQLIGQARYTFFIGPFPELDRAPELNETVCVDVVLAVATGVGLWHRYITGLFFDLCILSHIFTLWTSVYTFAQRNEAQSDSDADPSHIHSIAVVGGGRGPDPTEASSSSPPFQKRDWNTVYNEYKAIRELANLINKALGHIVTGFMAEALIFYSINLDVTLATVDPYKKAYMFYFYFHTVSILWVSADICNQMSSFKTWLAEDRNRKDIPMDELQIVLQEVHSNEVGIRGGGTFTLTYSLVASYCSLVVTYFIISVQHRNQIPSNALDG